MTGEYTRPKEYWFVTHRGVTSDFQDYIDQPETLRAYILSNWEDRCSTKITSKKTVTLSDKLKAHIEGFDFSIFRVKQPLELIEEHAQRRVELESIRNDQVQVSSLRQVKEAIERASENGKRPPRKWEPLPSKSVLMFCKEVEAILKEWNWKGEGRVEFDEATYDIVVDGQSRQSHGKGVRAVLYSAFVLALLRYCGNSERPHLGMVLIDSPLTSYRKGSVGSEQDGPIDPGMEAGFWRSLPSFNKKLQLIVLENKEPPKEVASAVHYEWFAGENASKGERAGFIPV